MTSPLRLSRADSMLILLGHRSGFMILDSATYRCLAFDGWSRAAVDRAVDDLVELGAVEIIANGGPIQIKLLEALA
jgi:hypothetical protein